MKPLHLGLLIYRELNFSNSLKIMKHSKEDVKVSALFWTLFSLPGRSNKFNGHTYLNLAILDTV